VAQAVAVVNEKMNDVNESENRALSEVKEFYNACMEALRNRCNDLGKSTRARLFRAIYSKSDMPVNKVQWRQLPTIFDREKN